MSTMEAPGTPRPVWARRKDVLGLFGIPRRQLDRLATDGVIRTAKFGTATQAQRVYRVEDLEQALVAVAEGREPQRPRRRGVRRRSTARQ